MLHHFNNTLANTLDSFAHFFGNTHLAKPQAVMNPTLCFWGDHIWVAEPCYSYIPGRTVSLINLITHLKWTRSAQLFYLTSIIIFIFNYSSELICSPQTSTLQLPNSLNKLAHLLLHRECRSHLVGALLINLSNIKTNLLLYFLFSYNINQFLLN